MIEYPREKFESGGLTVGGYMLLNLHVKNFAIINEIEVDFHDNLNIITGETGAGKSIIIGSVYVALGGKVTKEMIRTNAEYALVEMTFSADDDRVRSMLAAEDIPVEDDMIIITRKIMSNGRNILKVNGASVTASQWRDIASGLIDIHGQNEHQALLKNSYHLDVLDRYAKEDIGTIKAALKAAYHQYRDCKNELLNAETDESKRNRELSLLQYESDEIANARLVPGEDDELEAEYRKLTHAKVIIENISIAKQLMSEDDESASERLGRAYRNILRASEYDEGMADIVTAVSAAEEALNDCIRTLDDYSAGLENQEERFAEVGERLDVINRLKNKYGKSIEDIQQYEKKCNEKISQYEAYDLYLNELNERFNKSEKKVEDLSAKLSDIRQKKAQKLSKEISEALRELNFLQVRFEMAFNKNDAYSENGYDDTEFMISMNPGQAMLPLSKIASGGELSRIMLAIKSVLADADDIHTLIFDEIDSGISGRTAQKVAEKLAGLSGSHQIICITHLPQIAAMADTHFAIEKISDKQTTSTNIRLLADDESVEELARLLGGAEITDSVRDNAIEMKKLAKDLKGR